jgi:hypothetical protein
MTSSVANLVQVDELDTAVVEKSSTGLLAELLVALVWFIIFSDEFQSPAAYLGTSEFATSAVTTSEFAHLFQHGSAQCVGGLVAHGST